MYIYSIIIRTNNFQFMKNQIIQVPVQSYQTQTHLNQNPIEQENHQLKVQIGRVSNALKVMEEKYQKSLKQMSNIIHANKSLKEKVQNLKGNKFDDFYGKHQQTKTQRGRFDQHHESGEQNSQESFPTQEKKPRPDRIHSEDKRIPGKSETASKQFMKDNGYEIIGLQEKIKELKKKQDELEKQNHQLSNKLNWWSGHIENIKNNQKIAAQSKLNEQILNLREQNAQLLSKLHETMETHPVNLSENQLLNTLQSLQEQLEPLRHQLNEVKQDNKIQKQDATKEQSDLQFKILRLEQDNSKFKKQKEDFEDKINYLLEEVQQRKKDKKHAEELEDANRILEGKIIVYETMEMINRSREGSSYEERVKEFEARISLLMEEQKIRETSKSAYIHQLVSMKAYAMQLDGRLQKLEVENQHLTKKYRTTKEKYADLNSDHKKCVSKHHTVSEAYKAKIHNYEMLVEKLTHELEKVLESNEESPQIQASFNSVLSLYENQITSLYNDLQRKKQESDQQAHQLQQNTTLLQTQRDELNKIRYQNSRLINDYKNLEEKVASLDEKHVKAQIKTVVQEKSLKIQILEQEIKNLKKEHETHLEGEIQIYKRKLSNLEGQFALVFRENSQLKQEKMQTQTKKERFIEENRNLLKMIQKMKTEKGVSEGQVSSLMAKINEMEIYIETTKVDFQRLRNDLGAENHELRQHNQELISILHNRDDTIAAMHAKTLQSSQSNRDAGQGDHQRMWKLQDELYQKDQIIEKLKKDYQLVIQGQRSNIENEREQVIRKQEQIIHELNIKFENLEQHFQQQIQWYQNEHLKMVEEIEKREKIIQELEKAKGQENSQTEINYLKQVIADFEKHIEFIEAEMKEEKERISHEQIQEYQSVVLLRRSVNHLQEELAISNEKLNHFENVLIPEYEQQITILKHAQTNNPDKEALLLKEIEGLKELLYNKSEQLNQETERIYSLNHGLEVCSLQIERLRKEKKQMQLEFERFQQKNIKSNEQEQRIQQLLSSLMLTCIQVEALRDRITEAQQNFKREREDRIRALKQVQGLTEYDTRVHYQIIRELEEAHNRVYLSEKESKDKLKQRITQQIHVPSNSQVFQPSWSSASIEEALGNAVREGKSETKIQIVSPYMFQQQSRESFNQSYNVSSKNSLDEELRKQV